MRLHARAIAAITAGILGGNIYVQAASANTSIPGLLDPQLKGQARLSILGIVAYEGRLFTEGGTAFAPDSPAALELIYRRNFSAAQLARATRSELERLYPDAGGMEANIAAIQTCFRDVNDGDSYLAVSQSPDALTLWLNGTQTCRLTQSGIGQRFLSIWLSDESRYPRLSRQLRGQ